MKKLSRMAAILAALTLTLGLAVVPANASASVSLTVNQKATLSPFGNYITVTGTYTCTEPNGGLDQWNSGYGVQVTQIQGKRVVQGGAGFDPNWDTIVCVGTPQVFSFRVDANYNDEPATWKKGKAALSMQFGIENGLPGDDPNWDGAGTSASVVLQIGR
jgi:hypothetical protein